MFPVNPSDIKAFKNAVIQISSASYYYEPKTEEFLKNFSIEKVSAMYNDIFNKIN